MCHEHCTLCRRHCYLIYCMLCISACFEPWALHLHMLCAAYYQMFCTIGTANLYNIVCWILLHVLCHWHFGFIFCMLCSVTCLCYGHCCFICYMVFVMDIVALLNWYCYLYTVYCMWTATYFCGDCCSISYVPCTDVCLGYGYWLYVYYKLCSAVCHRDCHFVPWGMLLHMVYAVFCHMFSAFRHYCLTNCILCTAICLCCGHCYALCMYVVGLLALSHKHCCSIYCIMG